MEDVDNEYHSDSLDAEWEEIKGAVVTACAVVESIVEALKFTTRIERQLSINRNYERTLFLRRLYEESDVTCHEMLRMNRVTFNLLCRRLKGKSLVDSRYVTAKKQVAIFLLVIGHDSQFRQTKLEFIRSSETVHRHFHNVLRFVIKLGRDRIKSTTSDFSPSMCSNSKPWHHYFKDVVDITNELGMKMTKNNLIWSNEIDVVMIKVLQDQLVNEELNMQITGSHAQNRFKTWRKWAPEVKFITNLSGFRWDEESKTITGDANIGKTLLEVNGNKKYIGKTMVNYNAIYELVGKDIVTWSRARTIFTLDDEMTSTYNGNDNNTIDLDVDIKILVAHDTQDPFPLRKITLKDLPKTLLQE
ncbi:hypothetical protein GIB67_042344 [Kingdonia uniflora]|uniref:DUF8040 domain-containing protein n=1 Tax=Kingdonia uniflora TaxID=39325 RepID=A0A7J7LE29_9MAGN|nr:hypothetical protein GIB67_042344 [Kingdonia uniflora]